MQETWYKILNSSAEINNGETTKVQAGKKTLVVSKVNDKIGVIDNVCSHMGGPLGDGSLDDENVKCPWHGFEFHHCTGKISKGSSNDVMAYKVETRDDGIYVAIEEDEIHETTVSDVMVETMINWGVDTVFGMVVIPT